jgi:hypothetical protein
VACSMAGLRGNPNEKIPISGSGVAPFSSLARYSSCEI